MERFNMGDNDQSVSTIENGVIILAYSQRPEKQLCDVVFESGLRQSALESKPFPVTYQHDSFDCCAKGISNYRSAIKR